MSPRYFVIVSILPVVKKIVFVVIPSNLVQVVCLLGLWCKPLTRKAGAGEEGGGGGCRLEELGAP